MKQRNNIGNPLNPNTTYIGIHTGRNVGYYNIMYMQIGECRVWSQSMQQIKYAPQQVYYKLDPNKNNTPRSSHIKLTI